MDGSDRPPPAADPENPRQDEWSRNMRSLRDLERIASKLPRQSRGACDVAIAAICANIAQSTGLMFQSSALAMQQQLMTAQASAVKGVVELYRTQRQAHAAATKRAPAATPQPRSELFEMLQSFIDESATPPPRESEGNGGFDPIGG